MTIKELEKLYQMACDGKGYEPNDGQFKIWKQTLGWCEQADLAKALVDWFSTNVNFPMPAELKPLAERARRERAAKATQGEWYCAWRCPCCGYTMCGFLPENANTERRCKSSYSPIGSKDRMLPSGQICGALMELRNHEDTRTWKQERQGTAEAHDHPHAR